MGVSDYLEVCARRKAQYAEWMSEQKIVEEVRPEATGQWCEL